MKMERWLESSPNCRNRWNPATKLRRRYTKKDIRKTQVVVFPTKKVYKKKKHCYNYIFKGEVWKVKKKTSCKFRLLKIEENNDNNNS